MGKDSLLLGSYLSCRKHGRAHLAHHQAQRPQGTAANLTFPSSSPDHMYSTPCNMSEIVPGLDQGSNPEGLAFSGLSGLSLGPHFGSPHP